MNAAQAHLLLNHIPVLVHLTGIVVLAVGLLLKSRDVRNVGAWLIVAGALGAIPVYLTGEPAESVVKNYPDVSVLLVEDHQKSALISLVLLEFAGFSALLLNLASWRSKPIAARGAVWCLLLAVTLLAFGTIAWTAHLGGLIRHEEIRKSDRF